MTTNRLQPDSMIDEAVCATCDFNRPGKICDRKMNWSYRAEYLPAKRDDYNMIRNALWNETFPGRFPTDVPRSFGDLSANEQASQIRKRLTVYSKKVYHKVHETTTMDREVTICQRENPFYVNTVKSFRDRRYEFKDLQKQWRKKGDTLAASGDIVALEEAKAMVVLYDSLQLAHKVILNSFYGYVMRKGSRWYSMEMGGVTCLTGASIIQMARRLVEKIGRPLELDTDGIWCTLPESFPESFTFKLETGKSLSISYPCVMLNHLVHAQYTNHQYADISDPVKHKYNVHSENSIFFEIDGPYRAMILPASKEENKNLKKRYAVFNHDGTLAELKGFEVKRRGELGLIKIFQTQIFKVFLEGSSLEECYSAVAKVANRWLDVLFSKGQTLSTEELFDLISENRSMSRALEDYGTQKSTSISTAKRLAEFLGDQMIKDKGLNCKYIISAWPSDAPVADRAIPVAIFSAEAPIRTHFLRKWLKDATKAEADIREILDWKYYIERLGSVVQKLISIPAAMQRIENPVPRIPHPDWLSKRVMAKQSKTHQMLLTNMFSKEPMKDVTNEINGQVQAFQERLVPAKRTSPEPEAIPTKKLSPYVDYSGWIAQQKVLWKNLRIAQKQRSRLGTTSLSKFTRAAQSVYNGEWHILQLVQSNIAGHLRASVLINSTITHVTIRVPRIIYLSFKNNIFPYFQMDECGFKILSRQLPQQAEAQRVLQVTMPERVWQTKQLQLTPLLRHQNLTGIFESHITPLMRLLINVGSYCTLNPSSQGLAVERGVNLENLQLLEHSKQSALAGALQFLFLYYIKVANSEVIAFCSSQSTIGHVFVRTNNQSANALPSLSQIYSTMRANIKLESISSSSNFFQYAEAMKFETIYKSTSKLLFQALQKSIQQLLGDSKGPVIVIISSTANVEWSTKLPAISSLPLLKLPASMAPSSPSSIGWQTAAARDIVSSYLNVGTWLTYRLMLGKYSNIAPCNFEEDEPRFIIDILYARQLQSSGVLIWWNSALSSTDSLAKQVNIEQPISNLPNEKGMYTSVCVEIELRNLPINTILTSSLLEDSNSFVGSNDLSDPLSNETQQSSTNLAILKALLKRWWDEATIGNGIADLLVLHLVRWMRCSNSYLYLPSLKAYLDIVTQKMLGQLVSEFGKLGSRPIYASSDRVVIRTSKHAIENTYAYTNYILKAIRAKPQFAFLDFKIHEFWDVLLWLDEFNYGGKATAIIDSEEPEVSTILHWQIASFLPLPLQDEFKRWLVEFVDHCHRHKQQTGDSLSSQRVASSPTQNGNNSKSDKADIFISTVLLKALRKRVLQLFRRQQESSMRPDLMEAFQYPPVPSCKVPQNNPTLDFIKYLCAVIGLSKVLQLESRFLRRELLGSLEIMEFSKEGAFVYPSESLKLFQIVCNHCGTMRDLDFCRDDQLVSALQINKEDGRRTLNWACATCHNEYNRLAIEESLISDLQTKISAYMLQDLHCQKCKTIKGAQLEQKCHCSGSWVSSITRQQMQHEIKVFTDVAQFYSLNMALDFAQSLVV